MTGFVLIFRERRTVRRRRLFSAETKFCLIGRRLFIFGMGSAV